MGVGERKPHCGRSPGTGLSFLSRAGKRAQNRQSGWEFVIIQEFARLPSLMGIGAWCGMTKIKAGKSRRPATSKDALVEVTMPLELCKSVDAWAKRFGHTRASAIRLFIEIALKRKG